VLAFVRVDAERNYAEATRALEDAIRVLPEVVPWHYISRAGAFELQVMCTDQLGKQGVPGACVR
jgi:hypothetical protein